MDLTIEPIASTHRSAFLAAAAERGYIHQCTDAAGLDARLASGPVTAYVGYDCTADSLHIGSLIPVMALAHAQRHGHRPVVLIGGGTGLIGDPSFKATERSLLTLEQTAANAEGIRAQLSRFFDLSSPDKGLMVNNADWLSTLNYIEFLRDIGSHISVNRMLAAESVKLRLESESGLSFLEFNYSILQAYDFLVLNQRYDCELQVGGNDQWGNIVAGIDLIRRIGHDFGISILMSSHLLGEIERACDHLVVIDAGRLLRADTIASFTSSMQVLTVEVDAREDELAERLAAQGLVVREPHREGDARALELCWLWLREHAPALLQGFLARVFRDYWALALDASSREQVAERVAAVGADADACLAWCAAEGEGVAEALARELRERGLFQVPAFVVEDEVFS